MRDRTLWCEGCFRQVRRMRREGRGVDEAKRMPRKLLDAVMTTEDGWVDGWMEG